MFEFVQKTFYTFISLCSKCNGAKSCPESQTLQQIFSTFFDRKGQKIYSFYLLTSSLHLTALKRLLRHWRIQLTQTLFLSPSHTLLSLSLSDLLSHSFFLFFHSFSLSQTPFHLLYTLSIYLSLSLFKYGPSPASFSFRLFSQYNYNYSTIGYECKKA